MGYVLLQESLHWLFTMLEERMLSTLAVAIGGVCSSNNNKNDSSNKTVKYVASSVRAKGGASILTIDENPNPKAAPRKHLSILEIEAILIAERVKLQAANQYFDFSDLFAQITLPK
ncbi:hypothetical protein BCR33DRAFT_786182 [Rhizoclosmatium globosum]|uniref:Uncharacterized protein n=1 Tax=Rhizoclosmatium globosum TaxID=329046 RepID=A0A1Y2C7P0_9FUNG|nr:hypothetical protein BCR33DRAFT_786182 [Rhizoclosmatium globosum]|eukprot:ORY42914.1 hypothetical protein BCR33DRAFT_786182 [Rhizoclosmatium globosum]